LLLVCVLSLQVHTRPRVPRASGVPHALLVLEGGRCKARARSASRQGGLMSLGCFENRIGKWKGGGRVPDAVRRATLLRRTGTHAFCPRQRWAPALQHTTPQVRRAALRPARETSELNRLARIWHRRRQAAIDRDRLSVDVGGVVAGEKQSHRRQPAWRIGRAYSAISLTKRRNTRSLSSGGALRRPVGYCRLRSPPPRWKMAG
jgi:hypothetical protein